MDGDSEYPDWWWGFGFCGCGDPLLAMQFIYDRLVLLNDPQEEFDTGIEQNNPGWYDTDEPSHWFFMYWAEKAELAEHGTSVRGAWLTPKGHRVRDDIRSLLKIDERKKDDPQISNQKS